MDSVLSTSLITDASNPSPQEAAETLIATAPLSPSPSSPVKEDPLSFDDDEKDGADKKSVASYVSSDSDSFHSGGGEDEEFQSFPEIPSAADPDEVTLELPPSVARSEAPNPVAEASDEGEGDERPAAGDRGAGLSDVEPPNPVTEASDEGDDRPAADDDGAGLSDVVGVPPSLPAGSGADEIGSPSAVEKPEIGDSVDDGNDPSSEGNFSVATAAPGDDTVAKNPNSIENPEVRVLGRREEDTHPVAAEQSAENGAEVSKEDSLPENDAVDEKLSSAIEEPPAVETETGGLQSIESKDGAAGGKGGVDWKSWDVVVGTSSETNSSKLLTVLAGDGDGSIADNGQSFPDDGLGSEPGEAAANGRYESQNASSTDESVQNYINKELESRPSIDEDSKRMEMDSEISESSRVTSDAIVAETRISGPEISLENLSTESVPVLDVNGASDNSQLNKDEAKPGNAEDEGVAIEEHAQEMDSEILESSRVTSDAVVSETRISGPEISLESLSAESVPVLDVNQVFDYSQVNKDEGAAIEEHAQGPISVASKTAEQIIREMEHGSSSSQPGFESSREYLQKIDGQIMTDSDEEVDTDEEGEGKELFDSAALAALLKAASNAGSDGSVTISAPDAMRLFSTERPAGLGSTAPSLKPAPARSNRPNIFSPSDLAVVGDVDNSMDEEERKIQEKIQGIRVKFLRLVQRLGHSTEDTVASQVLYRLGLAEGIRRGRQTNRAFSLESARKTAMQMETARTDDLEFSCNILVLGKTGVGKSATINSIFGEEKTPISAFKPSTTVVREIVGILDGVKIRVIDTPGLRTSVMDQSSNRKILLSIKKSIKKCPPDIVLYIDRLDAQTRDFNDIPLLKSISTTLGGSIWLNAIVALTHAASAPPDGSNGSPLSYEVFIAQRSHIVQHSIRQAAGDMRLMNPVALVENHPSCRRNREGHRVLPNGQVWRSQLLLLCYSSKILSEANSLLKLQDSSAGKLFGFRVRSPPLPYLLSSLLQSRAHPKLPTDMGGENVDSDIDLDDLSDSDHEEEDEYDQLPPFKPLKKSQIDKLSKEQRKAYFEEYDYRVKLLQKKQWREELRRLRESKKRGKGARDEFGYGDMDGEDFDQENGSPAAVPVPLPDMVLPPSFDGDNPAYRYRFLEPTSQLLVRPVLDTHGWDHDCGYDGVSLEESLAIAGRFPGAVAVQVTKDKKEFNIHLDSSISAKHGEHGSTLAGFDIQSVGRQLAYILRGETKFQTFKKNKTTAGATVTFLGENVATGLKVEDQISIGKRVSLVASTGAIRSQGDMAYGANLEARLRDKEYPIGQDQSTLGLSLVKWRGDLALGANLQSQLSVGRSSRMAVRVGLNNKMSGQITIRTSSSEQLQIALVGILPVAMSIYRTFYQGESYVNH